jgi:hypothetical protein
LYGLKPTPSHDQQGNNHKPIHDSLVQPVETPQAGGFALEFSGVIDGQAFQRRLHF